MLLFSIMKSLLFSDSSRAKPRRGPPHPAPVYTILRAGLLSPLSSIAFTSSPLALSVTVMFICPP